MSTLPPSTEPMGDVRVTIAGTQQEEHREAPPSPRYVLIDTQANTVVTVSSPNITILSDEAKQAFRQLTSDWLRETAYDSDPADKFLHRAHLKLIAMGEKILPLALGEVEKMSGHWFVLLDAISTYNPVGPQDEMSLERTSQAWLTWGKEEGII